MISFSIDGFSVEFPGLPELERQVALELAAVMEPFSDLLKDAKALAEARQQIGGITAEDIAAALQAGVDIEDDDDDNG